MRDLVLLALLAWGALQSIRFAWFGALAWIVVSILNPHTYSWELMNQPVAMIIAVCGLIGVLASRDRKGLPLTRETLLLMAMMLWFCVTTAFSSDPSGNAVMLVKVFKIDFMVLVAMLVLHTRRHIMALVWTVTMSVGFYGFKGGLFTLATGGNYRVWGPVSTYIEGNNELALALIVAIPLMRFLQLQQTNKWVRHALTLGMLLCAIAAIGSHSRGALLAIGAMSALMWWRSENKLMLGAVFIVGVVAALGFLPEHWFSRMKTIETYEEDASAMGRINAWWMAFRLANDRFLGGGFQVYDPYFFGLYAPDPSAIHAAHSIYFQILGEHGWVGLILYLSFWWFTWLSAGYLGKLDRTRPELRWAADLGSMCRVSLAGFAVGGTFLSLAYFDMMYYVMAMVVLTRAWVSRQAWKTEEELAGAPAGGRPGVATSRPGALASPMPTGTPVSKTLADKNSTDWWRQRST